MGRTVVSNLTWVYPEVDKVTRVYKCHISEIDWSARRVWAPGDVCKLWRNRGDDDTEGLVIAVFDGGHELLVLWSATPKNRFVCEGILPSDHTLLAFNKIDVEAALADMRRKSSNAS